MSTLGRLRPADEKRRELARQVRAWPVEELHDRLAAAGVSRAFVLFENGEFTLSHPALLAPVQAFFELSQDFAQHEGVFLGREEGFPTVFFAFVHDTRRGLAQGGLRFKRYDTTADVLVDGLRLARGMTRKNALAGLWWGGGKGVLPVTLPLARPEYMEKDRPERRRLFEAYGRFVASIGGIYYTAEDIGTNTGDLAAVLGQNRFTTCIPPACGGSGNPSPFTAHGVYRAMQAAWNFLTGSDDLSGVRVAVQGAGHVGGPLIRELDEAGARVWFTDVDVKRIAELSAELPRAVAVLPDSIYDLEVDVFAPCAVGAVVSAQTIPRLKCRLVCGAANNILRETADAERLRERGIAFVPDYVCNRMGITNCADEWRGYLEEDVWVAAEKVYPDTLRVLKHARNLVVTPSRAADELADAAASELHPLLGHRGRRLADQLVAANGRGARQGRGPRTDAGTRKGRGAAPLFSAPLDEPALQTRWEKAGLFRGTGPAIAATPVSTATSPNLASFLSPLLADVRARAIEFLDGSRPRRVLGSDHGGLALQLAIEASLPHDREEYARPEFVEMCRDRHHAGDARVREELRAAGIGFDPRAWLDPMSEKGARVVRELYHALADAGRIARETRLVHRCLHCRTVLVASDVVHASLSVDRSYAVQFRTTEGDEIETATYQPELVLGAVAIGVRSAGRYGHLEGRSAVHPLRDDLLPVVAVPDLGVGAVFLVPAHSLRDERILREAGIDERPAVFDEKGEGSPAGYAGLPRDALREAVLGRLGDRVISRKGTWKVDAHRCRRCEGVTLVVPSEETFVHLESAAGRLKAGVESGAVEFGHPRWRDRVLAHLNTLEPWCISRQQWWGHEMPGRRGEVLSTWFSLAAQALAGAGWPEDPAPAPVAEVWVDPELLVRWVVPAELVSLAVTGRPVFRRIEVHGTLQTVDRSLAPQPEEGAGADESPKILPDEERFLFRTVHRPMRRNLGNVVSPASLVRRFGADALRLGLLLCLSGPDQDAATASETKLREARRMIRRLVAKV
ncbi:MAG: class I tRNA ligase family protein, partial [Planctomycetes bacterium]|nr:class I tRNA ligase family protein [Planctomycetota bacterium]